MWKVEVFHRLTGMRVACWHLTTEYIGWMHKFYWPHAYDAGWQSAILTKE